MGKPMYLKNVVTLALRQEKCTGCGLCEIVCPHGVFVRKDKRAMIDNRDLCMECGACARNCKAEAISVSAGVGCANAVINGFLNREGGGCCCVTEAVDENAASHLG
ncbi:MAG: mercury methylation ferredoxin HgcB [Myxococcota bacterium]|nr:mercury methylation ferredoxin HgcB [Myxococcota bacterium]